MKLVVDADTDKVLGASMCGPDAPEIMQVVKNISFGPFYLFFGTSIYIINSVVRIGNRYCTQVRSNQGAIRQHSKFHQLVKRVYYLY